MGNVSSHDIINNITKLLFAPDNRRIQGWIDQICNKNKDISDNKDPLGFWYNDKYYRPSWLLSGRYPKAILNHALYDEMDKLVKDERTTKDDQQFIRQTLFALVEPCETYQDLRDALPECLIDLIPNLGSFSRTREAGYIIKDNPRAYKQYLQILPKIETYCATRLIF
jgi:hypothetical protein